jgi:hypothetical protein
LKAPVVPRQAAYLCPVFQPPAFLNDQPRKIFLAADQQNKKEPLGDAAATLAREPTQTG